MDRRELLGTLGGLALVAVDPRLPRHVAVAPSVPPLLPTHPLPELPEFPRKADFAIPEGRTYINCAYTHPMPVGAAASVRRHLDRRSKPDADLPAEPPVDLKAEFAALINAKPSEISYITSTSGHHSGRQRAYLARADRSRVRRSDRHRVQPSRKTRVRSRVLSGGDAESVAEFIRVYRTRYDAFDAPLFIAGESYGVTRCALVAEALERRGTSLSGVIMMGLALPLGGVSRIPASALGLPVKTPFSVPGLMRVREFVCD